MQTLVRLGETERAERTLAALGDQDRDGGAMRTGLAVLRLALIADILSLLGLIQVGHVCVSR